jgi:phage terminase large subunit GpA-like protein
VQAVTAAPSPDRFPGLAGLLFDLAQLWTPPPSQSLSQWSEDNIVLSSEYAARSTSLRLFPWQREIFDAFTDPSIHEIDLFCARQLVKTLVIQSAVAYIACMDPGPILLVQPDDDAARSFSRERLSPMIRDCACLKGVISDSKAEGNLLLLKEFPGGSLALIGARSSSRLRRRTVRYLFCDEVDAYLASVGTAENKEGDPITIAIESMSTFGSRAKVILASTPTVAGHSRIGKAYRASDQRKPYVPCPTCGHYQILDFFRGVRWDNSLPVESRPASSYYECESCHSHWSDFDRKSACERAEWRAHAPFAGVAGFWISHLYSPWKSLADIVAHFFRVKDDRNLYQAFMNTVLAIEWVDEGQTPDHQILYDRRDSYAYGDMEGAVVPARGLFLTAAVDVQDSPPRLEVETVAWGRGGECWSMDYRVIQVFADDGQPMPVTSRAVWDKLDAEVLSRSWPHENGKASLPIWVMCVDTGNRPKPVYEFARRHSQLSYDPGTGIRLRATRTVVPTKGNTDPLKLISSISKEDAIRKRQGVRIVSIGTYCAKQQIYDALQHIKPRPDNTRSGAPSPGCYHHPQYDMPYFLGLTAETRVEQDTGKVVWEKRYARNEPLDTKVMNRAGASICGIDRWGEDKWKQLEEVVGASKPVQVEVQDVSTAPATDLSAASASASASVPTSVPARAPTAYSYPRRTVRKGFR